MGSGARGIPRVRITMQIVEEKTCAIAAASLLFLSTPYYITPVEDTLLRRACNLHAISPSQDAKQENVPF